MNANEYCNKVEKLDLLHKRLSSLIGFGENNSPLVSLKECGIDLIYEPSIINDYQFLVRQEIVEKIERINRKLLEQEKKLIIRSAWRSFYHQRKLWENKVEFLKTKHPEMSNKEIEKLVSYFIAPFDKSMHSTGGAIDALVYDMRADCVMDFGTNDGLKIYLSKKCYPYHPDISNLARKNRKLLIDLFEAEDFVCDIKEYWHFDYGNNIWAIQKGEEKSIYGMIM